MSNEEDTNPMQLAMCFLPQRTPHTTNEKLRETYSHTFSNVNERQEGLFCLILVKNPQAKRLRSLAKLMYSAKKFFSIGYIFNFTSLFGFTVFIYLKLSRIEQTK